MAECKVEINLTNDVVCFYSGVFSHWYRRLFKVNGVTYCCGEQYLMAQKALLFGDRVTHKKIMLVQNPKRQKELGRQVKGFNSSIWDKNKKRISTEANWAKFSQHPDLMKKLFDTGSSVLAEASPYDRIWGIGLGINDPRSTNQSEWKGENILGQVLVRVRDKLRHKFRVPRIQYVRKHD